VATARRERYARPGALPRVEPAGVLEDLERRDFTVNTLAIGVAGPVREGLLAHPRGLADLRRRRIRVLHARSFHDDPTRLLRAVDLEAKLGGRIEPTTEVLARRAVRDGVLEAVSGSRLWVEIEASLRQAPAVPAILRRWADLGLWEALFPGTADVAGSIRLVEASLDLAERLAVGAKGAVSLAPTTTLMALARTWSDETLERWIARFAPPRAYRRALREARARVEAARAALATALAAGATPSTVHRALSALTLPELALLGALVGATAADWVVREVEELRPTRLRIGAADLLARGAEPGPALGAALAATLAAVLDGVVDRRDELDYALAKLGIREGRRRRQVEPESPDP
jgi:tRNA nucleotidyltransferase (CCA-adding enzyme)